MWSTIYLTSTTKENGPERVEHRSSFSGEHEITRSTDVLAAGVGCRYLQDSQEL